MKLAELIASRLYRSRVGGEWDNCREAERAHYREEALSLLGDLVDWSSTDDARVMFEGASVDPLTAILDAATFRIALEGEMERALSEAFDARS